MIYRQMGFAPPTLIYVNAIKTSVGIATGISNSAYNQPNGDSRVVVRS